MDNPDIARRLMRKFNRNAEYYTSGDRKNDHRKIMPAADDLLSWEDCENGRLSGPIVLIAGTALHLEAIEVVVDYDGYVAIKNEDDDLAAALLCALEDDVDSPLQAVNIAGRHYVIYAAPSPASSPGELD
jgi:hypothetical protein